MRTRSGAIGLAILATGGLAAAAAPRAITASADEAAIRQTIQYYFDGGTRADSATLAKAFHPEARMLFVREGTLAVVPVGEYIARVGSGKPAPADDPTRKRIVSIDVTGDAAVARLEITRPGQTITDYMSLLKVGGEWKIVNKIFTRQ
ncbi:MAG TPA: nuclear transport factor 2 family protein [Gemmatimonadales bacterium]|nr:nuclear transport factor 2 family protein [Gemmatimonadales bacterium]